MPREILPPKEAAPRKDLDIARISVREIEDAIPFHTFDEVADAIRLFTSGQVPSSKGGVKEVFDALGAMDPVAVPMFTMGMSMVDEESSVQRLITRVKKEINESPNGYFRDSWDYFAPAAPLIRNGMRVKKLADGSYFLGIDNSKGEIRLAETLDKDRGLSDVHVKVELNPEGEKFSIDTAEIAKILAHIEGLGFDATEEEIAEDLLWRDSAELGKVNGQRLSVWLWDLGRRFGDDGELWVREGSVLSGPLAPDNEVEGKNKNPQIIIRVHAPGMDAGFEPDVKRGMKRTAYRITEAFERYRQGK